MELLIHISGGNSIGSPWTSSRIASMSDSS